MIGGDQKTDLPTKVLLLGSGGLSIGQAGEFDYSGNQALKAMREEGVEVVLVNPNIATVQTNPEENVSVYLYPVEAEWVERVIEKERPDGIIASFGGQTALNCLIELDEKNVLKKYGVENLGTPVSVLKMTEDRDEFSSAMQSINQPIPASIACENL
ncbi:MAG: carbamoyl-phosphate synthase large subunit, partial [Pseudomonadales bacterium]